MKILALELSTSRGSLAWRDGDVASFSREWPNDRRNSAAFFENLAVIAKQFGSPDTIVVGLGPGSYAGTRIAISAAIGLQISSRARLVGFPSICAIESSEPDYCVIGDARRKSFFLARISGNELMEGPELFGDEGLKDKLASLRNNTPIFCSESLPQFSEAMVRQPSAQLLARLAQDPERNFKLPPLEPMYLREPHVTMANAATRPTIGR
jgi:tRNA threonylcarbamoyladenosine biosynthesis protein TsaB